MIHENGNRILDGLERRFHGLALPGILRWIAGFQAFCFALSLFSPDFLEWIAFHRDSILSGQVWRLFSWVFFPAGNPFFVIIALLFMFFINDSLEGHWGAFRLNAYVLSSILFLAAISMIPVFSNSGFLLNGIFYSCCFLAFASLFPNQIIHLFLIIPIKAKWLGIANALLLAAMVLTSPAPILVGAIVVAGLVPYLLVFVPSYLSHARLRSENAVRRHRFQQAATTEDAFHRCDSCGATDETHPERHFRVSAEGKEYCDACRPLEETEAKD